MLVTFSPKTRATPIPGGVNPCKRKTPASTPRAGSGPAEALYYNLSALRTKLVSMECGGLPPL